MKRIISVLMENALAHFLVSLVYSHNVVTTSTHCVWHQPTTRAFRV